MCRIPLLITHPYELKKSVIKFHRHISKVPSWMLLYFTFSKVSRTLIKDELLLSLVFSFLSEIFKRRHYCPSAISFLTFTHVASNFYNGISNNIPVQIFPNTDWCSGRKSKNVFFLYYPIHQAPLVKAFTSYNFCQQLCLNIRPVWGGGKRCNSFLLKRSKLTVLQNHKFSFILPKWWWQNFEYILSWMLSKAKRAYKRLDSCTDAIFYRG